MKYKNSSNFIIQPKKYIYTYFFSYIYSFFNFNINFIKRLKVYIKKFIIFNKNNITYLEIFYIFEFSFK